MRRYAALGLIILTLVTAAFPGTARACSCGPRQSPTQALQGADAVFRGRVSTIGRFRTVEGYERVTATITVDEVWKGEVGREVVVYTGTGGGDCGFTFNIGSDYLIYADAFSDRMNTIDYGLSTGICSRSTLVGQAGEDFAALGPGKPPSTSPQPNLPSGQRYSPQCFPQTEKFIDGRFFTYWKESGGLAIHGYPLTEARYETLEDGNRYRVQWFERTRLEEHADPSRRESITLGQFGRFIHPPEPPAPPVPGGRYFPETGQTVARAEFITFWETNGGLPQFGYPISAELTETLEDGNAYTVQYFERARFEWHPEQREPYRVQLGQFGRRILAERSNPDPAPSSTPGQQILRGHTDCVTAATFGASGNTVASAGYDGTIRLWNIPSGTSRGVITGHTDAVTRLAVSPDGRFLASASRDCSLRIWDQMTGAPLHTLYPHRCSIEALAFSPDSRFLASGGMFNIILWDPSSGQQVRQLSGEPNAIPFLAFSPDSSTLAGGYYFGQIILWDVATGTPRALPYRPTSPVAATFTPDGRYLISSALNDSQLTVWDIATGEEIRSFKDDRCWVNALAMTPNGTLISGGYRTICTWNLTTGTAMQLLQGHGNRIAAIAVSPDGRWLVSGGFDTTVRLWPLTP